jgi:RNA-directed DNA polymerase
MQDKPVYYRRYMDDIIVLSPSRWKLRKAIITVNQHFEKLKLKQHHDKTVRRIKNGFDFLGCQFGKEKTTVSKRTLQNHIRRLSQLYEQKSINQIGRCFLMIIDNIGLNGLANINQGIPSSIINFETQSVELSFFLKST